MPSHPPSFREGTIVQESRARAVASLVITCLLVVLVPGMVALIGYRSIMMHGPSTAVVVVGDSSLDGAKIEVTELIDPHRKWPASLDVENDWQTPILLDPGPYHITVTHRGKEILNENFAPDQLNGVRFDLPAMVWIIGNASLANSRIEVVHSGNNAHIPHVTPVKLNADDRFRAKEYLLAGEYRAIARDPMNGERILAQVDFTVDRASQVRVDLAKAASGQAE